MSEPNEDVVDAMLRASIQAMVAVKEKVGKERGVAGSMPCPCCETGTLFYCVSAYNGHTRGNCTSCCVRWME